MSFIHEVETRRFSTEEVLRMVEVGVIGEDEPLELLDGRLVVVSPQGPQHRFVVGYLAERLRQVVRGVVVQEEKPIAAGTEDLPEPDVAVVAGAHRDFVLELPTGRQASLVVEVAVTSQRRDRAKAELYARAGVPVYWLFDIPARRVEVYSDPLDDGQYRTVHILGEEDDLEVPGADARLSIRELLP